MAQFIVAYDGSKFEDKDKVLVNLDHVQEIQAQSDDTTRLLVRKTKSDQGPTGFTYYSVDASIDVVAVLVGAILRE